MNLEPIHVPYRYNEQDRPTQKIIYALGQLAEASAEEIVEKIRKSNPAEKISKEQAEEILKGLFDLGLIKGEKNESTDMKYNLSKILKPNSGRTEIDGLKDV